MTEVELIEACRRGDRDAFARVVERYQRMVEAVAFGATGDPAIVDDVVQDAFVCAWQSLALLRDPARLRPWLRSITRHIGCKARRRRVREAPLVETPRSTRTPFDEASERERDDKIITALRRLPARYREPLVLFYYESCTVAEVAHTLGLREDLVLQRLSRGRKRLGEVLAVEVEIGLERRPSRVALAGAVVALVAAMRTDAAAAVAVRAAGEGGAGTWSVAVSTWLVRVAPKLRAVGAVTVVAGAVGLVAWGAERSQEVAARNSAQQSVAWPRQDSEVAKVTAPLLPANPAASSSALHQSVSVASPDPVESCARATRNLVRRMLDKDAIVQIGDELYYRPDPDIQRTVEAIGERVGSTCDVGTWPELYVVCEGTVEEIIDGNITCYPYDPFA